MATLLFRVYNLVPLAKRGQATLSLAILVGGTAVLIGVTVAFLTLSFIETSQSFQAGNRALTVAGAGARDALLQLVRNKSFSSAAGYTIQLGNDKATVRVRNSSLTSGRVSITSEASVLGNQRKIQVIASLDPLTGKVGVILWQQQVIQGSVSPIPVP